jgi:phosphatidylglycerol---prolipoprotein diacylglyceryl transferase
VSFTHNLDPVAVSIGPLSIHWYGLVYFAGFLSAYIAYRKLLQLTAKEADSLVLYQLLGMLFFSRVFIFVFYYPHLFSITEFFAVWRGGMSFHGGLVGLLSATWLWARLNQKNAWEIADLGAVIAAFFLALGRVANFVNAEIIGTRTDVAWCVQYPGVEGCRHPVQLYAAIKNLAMGSVLVLLWRSKKVFQPGFIFWCFATLYGVLRFFMQFYRTDSVVLFGLQAGHLLSLVLLVVAVYVLFTRHRLDAKKLLKAVRS